MELNTVLSSAHPVVTGKDCLQEMKKYIPGSTSKIFILVDENSEKHCFPLFKQNLKDLNLEVLKIKSGEVNKSLDTCTYLWETLINKDADRKSLLINLGGGVIGDMGGFVASTFKRGINFMNVPTTLLSQVDASIGGKVGIDFKELKNELGLFSNPLAVFIEPDFLRTLPERELLSGFAEVIKHALIADKEYWKEISSLTDLSADKISPLVFKSINIKREIVEQDPKEEGIRKVLNFGHTIGHAIESYFLKSSSPLLHGEAVVIGMICESFLSFKKDLLSKEQLDEVSAFIFSVFQKMEINKSNFQDFIQLMKHDKKSAAGEINFSLIGPIGHSSFNQICQEGLILEALEYYISYEI